MPVSNKVGLSKRQKDCLDAVQEFIDLYSHSPSIQDIAERLDTYPSNAWRLVGVLIDKGYLVRDPGRNRSINVAEGV